MEIRIECDECRIELEGYLDFFSGNHSYRVIPCENCLEKTREEAMEEGRQEIREKGAK